ncbi:MAG: nicotinate (nicotinamide) nucleotide adenylyltransferase [Myxococcales bacterium]|nr:nicotinate (nicotinamide) nucleotide adenylyltransferase [Myxococcota bacterium]MDW8280571.1 nicotinate (nicotinamide) nucleotide adenylyltransferase [Myxococcales bacterium]
MRIALYGGSFDPPHIAHQMACLYVLSIGAVDEVWMIPCYQHPFDKRSAPFAHRVAMCRLAGEILGERVRVCTIEEELGGQSYTLRTVRALQERHPEHTFILLIGSDLVQERQRWFGWPELARRIPFFVVGRMGVEGPAAGASVVLPAVSSTAVRAELAAGRSPTELVPRAVLDYIEAHGLYRASAGG